MKHNLFNHRNLLKSLMLLVLASISNSAFAIQQLGQFAEGTIAVHGYGGTSELSLYIFAGVAAAEFVVVLVLTASILRLVDRIHASASKEVYEAAKKRKSMSVFSFERIHGAVSMEEEKDYLMDHEYDGIQELDNKLPPWFLWLFYGSACFAVCYLMIFHVFHLLPTSEGEYANQMKAAEIQMEAYRKKVGTIDETNAVLITDPAKLKEGEAIFKANCTPCHGQEGQGIIGPNLTDDYWLHGCSVGDIFKTIKYGQVAKGMKAWEQDMSPSQMQNLVGYILSLNGTNPSNPKAPQGDYCKDVGGKAVLEPAK